MLSSFSHSLRDLRDNKTILSRNGPIPAAFLRLMRGTSSPGVKGCLESEGPPDSHAVNSYECPTTDAICSKTTIWDTHRQCLVTTPSRHRQQVRRHRRNLLVVSFHPILFLGPHVLVSAIPGRTTLSCPVEGAAGYIPWDYCGTNEGAPRDGWPARRAIGFFGGSRCHGAHVCTRMRDLEYYTAR